MNPESTPSSQPSARRRWLVALPLTWTVAGAAATLSMPTATPAQQPPAAARAAADTGLAADFEAAYARMLQGGRGDEAAIADATERFTRLAAANPDDPVLRAYAGATTAMRARTTMLPWKKIGWVEDGLALVDKALAQLAAADDAPRHRGVSASLETRYVAANTFLALPSMFNRNERGRRLLEQVVASPLFDAQPAAFRATAWLRAGRLAEDDRQGPAARQWYERVAASGTALADEARRRLGGL